MKLVVDATGTRRGLPLFGLAPLERLRRTVAKLPSAASVRLWVAGDDPATRWPGADVDPDPVPLGMRLRRELARGESLVAVDAADAIDPRLLGALLQGGPAVVAERGEAPHRAVALRLSPELADAVPDDARHLVEVADALRAAGRIDALGDADVPGYIDKLRRTLAWWLDAVPDSSTRRRLERRMFLDNYKGSTDFLTRYVYPPLVWPLVRLCTRLRVHPNAVTLVSVLLAFAAVPLFARGDWLAGFACAYAMSLLDSVDGKVARLTLTDSRIGNVLDHGLDQVHPPFWYVAWALGLGARGVDDPLLQAAVWLVAFYVVDRLVLALAKRRLGFALHAATRLDGRVRSFIARRNVTMTIMAASILVGAGAAGFYAVLSWQALTFVWHALRTAQLGFFAGARVRPDAST